MAGTLPNSRSGTFAEALKKAETDATIVVIKGDKHGGALFTNAESMKLIEDFFRNHFISLAGR